MYLILDALLNWLANRRSPDIVAAVSNTIRKSFVFQSREKLADNSFLISTTSLYILPLKEGNSYNRKQKDHYHRTK